MTAPGIFRPSSALRAAELSTAALAATPDWIRSPASPARGRGQALIGPTRNCTKDSGFRLSPEWQWGAVTGVAMRAAVVGVTVGNRGRDSGVCRNGNRSTLAAVARYKFTANPLAIPLAGGLESAHFNLSRAMP